MSRTIRYSKPSRILLAAMTCVALGVGVYKTNESRVTTNLVQQGKGAATNMSVSLPSDIMSQEECLNVMSNEPKLTVIFN